MDFKKNKNYLMAVLSVLLIIGGSLIVKYYFSKSINIKPKSGDVVESIYGLGTVTADKVFHVRAAMALMVQKIFVKEGEFIKSGDALVKLDENIMRSPLDGTVTAISYKDGELITPQTAVVTVMNLEHLFLEVSLEQQSILRVKTKQEVSVSFESLREDKYEGVVTSVYPRDNQFIVRIDLKKWPSGVLPGMTADVAILVGKKTNVLLIPIKSITSGQVYRIRNGKKDRVPVKLGVVDGEWGEIISDNISLDDELLTRK